MKTISAVVALHGGKDSQEKIYSGRRDDSKGGICPEQYVDDICKPGACIVRAVL